MATIGIKLNDEVISNLDQTEYDYQMDFNQHKIHLTVICDNNAVLNHFNIESDDCSWVEIKRLRNEIDFVVSENYSLNERYARIVFKHNLDSEVTFAFNIVQEAHDYTISVDVDEYTFDTLLDQDNPNSSNVIINVTAEGGLCDFGIKPVREFVKSADADNFHEVIYDKGLNILKLDKNRLLIRNYGKVALYDEVYYEVTVYNCHDAEKTCLIKINYTLDTDSGFGFDDE